MPAPFVPLRAPGWLLDLAARPQLAQVLRDANLCIGMGEHPPGSNRGPQIDEWLQAAGVAPGSPWCAAFATALYQRLQPAPIPRLASALKLHEWATAHGRLVPEGAPVLPGDLCGLFHTDDPATPEREDFRGHVGLVVADLGADFLATVEGNTHSMVRGRVHRRSAWQWFVRPLPL